MMEAVLDSLYKPEAVLHGSHVKKMKDDLTGKKRKQEVGYEQVDKRT